MCDIRLALLASLLLLAACGGGGGGESGSPPPPPPPAGVTVTLNGVAEKGPFASGAQLSVTSLFADGSTNASVANVLTRNQLGSFSVGVPADLLVEVAVQGRFYNELDGTSSTSPLTLKSILRVASSGSQVANINVLTHLAVPRIRMLLAGGAAAPAAETQAKSDVLAALTDVIAPPQLDAFGSVSLYSESRDDEASAYLVTISALFSGRALELSLARSSNVVTELQGLLDRVAGDIADGVIDNPAALLALRDASYGIDPLAVANNLNALANGAGSALHAGNLLMFVDTDLDGELSNIDTDDDNDGIADVNDAYPFDWSCYLASDGNGSACTVESTVPASYVPDAIDSDGHGNVYVLSADNNRVYRWSIDAQRYGFPLDLPPGASSMAYSPSHNRLYVGFASGAVIAIETVGQHAQSGFIASGKSVRQLVAAGDFLLVIDDTDTGSTYSYDGTLIDEHSVNSTSPAYAWSMFTNRLYQHGPTFTRYLQFLGVDPQSGEFGSIGESPYNGDFAVLPPLRLSADGKQLLDGAGDVYDADTLEWQRALPGEFADIAWLADNTIVDIRTDDSGTRLEHRNARGAVNEYGRFSGTPLRVIARHARFQLITQQSRPVFHLFRRGGDHDEDGAPNIADDFPLDPAAAVDSDGDGYPDSWNAGKGPADSSTGLVLDAYPNDSACALAAHGNGSTCDIAARVPQYVPDWTVIDKHGVVYLLNAAHNRIFRWDSSGAHLNPLPIGSDEGDTATFMRYSTESDRLYLAYDSGKLTYFDTSNPVREQYFASAATEPFGLQPAGNFLWLPGTGVQVGANYALTFSANGDTADRIGFTAEVSRHSAWSSASNRVYLFRESASPNDILYQPINPSSGALGAAVDSPYHGDYEILPPIRVAADGSKVLIGSGDLYDAADLTWAGAVPGGFVDAQWDGDNVVVARNNFGASQVVRRNGSGQVVDVAQFTGAPLAVLPSGDAYVIVTDEGRPSFYTYAPSDDADGDGVSNIDDDFPLDPAASVDTDHDGFPDDWNPGMSEADSTTGLALDAYPNDSACYLPEHGDGTTCDITATIPEYLPSTIAMDNTGVINLFSPENRRIYRWDAATQEHLNPFVIGSDPWLGDSTPTVMRYHVSHHRLYVGYDNGDVTYIDLAGGLDEHYLTTMAKRVNGLADAGNFLLVQDDVFNFVSHHIYDADGVLRGSRGFNTVSREYAWNPALNRVYYFRDGLGPNDVLYEVIDQASGLITANGDTPYHGEFAIEPPLRVSANGDYVLVGSGDIYGAGDLTRRESMPGGFVDARWNAQDEIVSITADGNDARVERRNDAGFLVEKKPFDGMPLGILPSGPGYVVVTDQGRPAFELYLPSNDSDSDGTENNADAFPLDPAASVDSDGDAYPDAWHAGMSEADSTTGLVLDAYPDHAACYLPQHGDGSTCDITATMPDYVPSSIALDGAGIVHLFSPENWRIYRWDTNSEEHLEPYTIGVNRWLHHSAPSSMLYHVAHDRLYLGYDNGDINYIDLAGGSTEQPFATSTSAVGGLGDAGNFLLVQDVINTSTPHYFFDADGGLRNETTTSSYSREYAWNPWLDRLFFSDDNASPSVLAYEDIDQASGEVLAGAATPYWEFLISPPIRISSDGARVMVGTGHIFDAGNLDWLGSIPGGFVDARWRDDDGTVVVRDDSGNARVERRDASRNIVEFAEFDGVPLAMMPAGPGYLVVSDQGRPGFHWYVPTDDSDGDGVANTVDAFPFDVAASIDSDGDGYPDAWNPGMGVADSTTGLAIDAYPNDSACFLLAHGDGTNCDVTSTLPDYLPSKIEIDNSGVVYLFSPANQRVYRWSAAAQSHVNPLIVGRNPWLGGTTPAIESYHAAHHRLYLGYQNGDITYIDLGDGPGEQLLNRLPEPVLGIADVGAFLMTQDNRKEGTDSIFDANGTLRHSENNTHFSNTYEWAPVPGRLYQFRDDVSPNDILYRPVDQSSGQIGTLVDSPYHGAFEIKPPIRVSPNGSNVLLGSGDIYDANSLVWLNRMPAGFADVRWTDTGGTVMLQANGTNSQVVRRDNNGDIAELVQFSGEPLAILPFGDDYVVVTDLGGPMFAVYVPNDDTDGDGVMNADDAFPLDPAASVDSDGDGYPDAWNPGKSEADSTTGLVLDAYPNDFACYLPEHGDGVSCDLTSTIPHYLPTSVMIDDAGVVYLFSPENRRIYRWDAVTREHLNPFVIGPGIETGGAPPRHMAYQSTQFRLYFGYDNGEVTFIDLAAGPDEQNFLTRPVAVLGLADVGNFLLLHDSISGRTTSVFDADGTFLSSRRLLRNSLKFVWNPVLERVYFLRDDVSPNDIHYQTVDQATGALGLAVDSPYNGGYQIQHPIRISSDGSKVLVGGGDVFNAGDLTWLASISTAVTDAAWLNDGRIATIRADGPNTIFEVFGTSYTSQSTQTIPDLPIASMHYNGDVVVITQGATPEFIVITP